MVLPAINNTFLKPNVRPVKGIFPALSGLLESRNLVPYHKPPYTEQKILSDSTWRANEKSKSEQRKT
jgi:hypothetical protein